MTGGSRQSANQLLNVCASLGIQDKQLTDMVLGIKATFVARNEIVHEMDLSSSEDGWKRWLRRMGAMTSMAHGVFGAARRSSTEWLTR